MGLNSVSPIFPHTVRSLIGCVDFFAVVIFLRLLTWVCLLCLRSLTRFWSIFYYRWSGYAWFLATLPIAITMSAFSRVLSSAVISPPIRSGVLDGAVSLADFAHYSPKSSVEAVWLVSNRLISFLLCIRYVRLGLCNCLGRSVSRAKCF